MQDHETNETVIWRKTLGKHNIKEESNDLEEEKTVKKQLENLEKQALACRWEN